MEGRRALFLPVRRDALLYVADLGGADLLRDSLPPPYALRNSAPDHRLAQARNTLDRHSLSYRHDDVWLGRAALFRAIQNTAKRGRDLRRRQAVDVETADRKSTRLNS